MSIDPQSFFSSPVNIVIMSVLIIVFMFSLTSFIHVRNQLNQFSIQLKKSRPEGETEQMIHAYSLEQQKSNDPVSVQSFVESYFSSWVIPMFGYKVNVVKQLKIINQSISFSILVGVLGTFIGLTQSLDSINLGDSDNGAISAVLSGASVAFYTSIMGMAVSMVLTVVSKFGNAEHLLVEVMLRSEKLLENKQQNRNQQEMLSALHQTNKRLDQIGNKLEQSGDFAQSFQLASENMLAFNEGFKSNMADISEIFGSMRQFTEQFGEQISMLNHNFHKLFHFMEGAENDRIRHMEAWQGLVPRMTKALDDNAQAQTFCLQSMEHQNKVLQDQYQAFSKLTQHAMLQFDQSGDRMVQINNSADMLLQNLHHAVQQVAVTLEPDMIRSIHLSSETMSIAVAQLQEQLPIIYEGQKSIVDDQKLVAVQIREGMEQQGKMTTALRDTVAVLESRFAGSEQFIQDSLRHLETVMERISSRMDEQVMRNFEKSVAELRQFTEKTSYILDKKLGSINEATELYSLGAALQVSTAAKEMQELLPPYMDALKQAIQEHTTEIRNGRIHNA